MTAKLRYSRDHLEDKIKKSPYNVEQKYKDKERRNKAPRRSILEVLMMKTASCPPKSVHPFFFFLEHLTNQRFPASFVVRYKSYDLTSYHWKMSRNGS